MNKVQGITLKEIEKLLDQQTVIILDAVSKKIEKSEQKTNAKIGRLTTLIDKFVNLYTKQEQEFKIMKYELNQIKKVIKDKLGVEIT